MQKLLLACSLVALTAPSAWATKRSSGRAGTRAKATKPWLVVGPLRLGQVPLTPGERKQVQDLRKEINELRNSLADLQSQVEGHERNRNHVIRQLNDRMQRGWYAYEKGRRNSVVHYNSQIRWLMRIITPKRAALKQKEKALRRLGGEP